MSSVPERRTKGRRRRLNKIWNSKEWKLKKADFLKKNPLCKFHLGVLLSKLPESGRSWLWLKAANLTGTDARADLVEDLKTIGKENLAYLVVLATTPHHPYMESAKDPALYLDLYLSKCVPSCAKCHFTLHKGMNLCPKCGEHYKRWDQEICRRCWEKANPMIVKDREATKIRFKEEQRQKRKAAYQKAKEKRAKK